MTIQGFTIQDKHGRAIAFVCQNDVVMRAGPEQKIETRFGVPYYDAGWRPFHAECLEVLA
jgi:hypothetical protein